MASLYKTEGHWVVDIYRMGRVRFGKNKADAALAYRLNII